MATLLLDSLFKGLGIGSVLLIAALGLAIIFGLMGVINLAHGELMMLGAYATFVVQNIFKPLGEPWYSFYIIVAIPVAFIVSAIVGLILERGAIRFLYGRPLETLLATWGVSLILQQFVRSVSWLLFISIGIFVLFFFGGLKILKSKIDWAKLKNLAIAILLILSGAIATVFYNLLKANSVLTKARFSYPSSLYNCICATSSSKIISFRT